MARVSVVVRSKERYGVPRIVELLQPHCRHLSSSSLSARNPGNAVDKSGSVMASRLASSTARIAVNAEGGLSVPYTASFKLTFVYGSLGVSPECACTHVASVTVGSRPTRYQASIAGTAKPTATFNGPRTGRVASWCKAYVRWPVTHIGGTHLGTRFRFRFHGEQEGCQSRRQ